MEIFGNRRVTRLLSGLKNVALAGGAGIHHKCDACAHTSHRRVLIHAQEIHATSHDQGAEALLEEFRAKEPVVVAPTSAARHCPLSIRLAKFRMSCRTSAIAPCSSLPSSSAPRFCGETPCVSVVCAAVCIAIPLGSLLGRGC